MTTKDKQKLLSVVIPVYKVEDYLENCVDSIILNTKSEDRQFLEIILVDDGSPDKSPEICDNLKARYENIKVIHKENGGVSSARNEGINIATGKYITFSDSDDYVTIQFGEVFDIIRQDDGIDVFSVGIKKNNKILSQFDEKLLNSKSFEDVYFFAKQDVTIGCWAKIIRRDFLLENNLLFPIGKKSEDYAWSINTFLKSKSYKLLPLNYYVYVEREFSATHSFSLEAFKSQVGFAEFVFGLVQNLSFSKLQKKRILKYWMEMLYYSIGSIKFMTDKDKIEAINIVCSHKYLLIKPAKKKLKFFYVMTKVIGARNAIKLIAK